jgi:hypothetical protein
MNKKKWIAAIAGVAAVLVIGAGAVMAQTPATPSATPSFLDRVAQKLGIDTSKLKDAITGARNDQVDEGVKNGDLTQKQADALKQRIANSPNGGFGPGMGGRGFKGGFGGPGFGPGLAGAETKLADFLGITPDQLKTELRADKATLATVAAAHGKSRDDLKKFVTDTAKSSLDTAVKNGDLTQKVEDTILQKLNDNLDKIVDSAFGHGFGMGFPGGRGHHGGPWGGNMPAPGAPSQGGQSTPQQQSGSGIGSFNRS